MNYDFKNNFRNTANQFRAGFRSSAYSGTSNFLPATTNQQFSFKVGNTLGQVYAYARQQIGKIVRFMSTSWKVTKAWVSNGRAVLVQLADRAGKRITVAAQKIWRNIATASRRVASRAGDFSKNFARNAKTTAKNFGAKAQQAGARAYKSYSAGMRKVANKLTAEVKPNTMFGKPKSARSLQRAQQQRESKVTSLGHKLEVLVPTTALALGISFAKRREE